ncbi:hypothetical protein LOK49_LG02G02850 [Camellia lanceoleosa]|uniref:Uncharacterized protein n=1 Tax=Camellia lanceoleosa TaxID=1840588 RepID=A0ACC0IIG0_9ERIC|nr:hypothetical protein LOK49_LG02G02850 [Camellia lanceoleosa]
MGDPSRSGNTTNFYNILGIPKSASLLDVTKAYKTLVMKWHPDKNESSKPEAEDKIRGINEAYRVFVETTAGDAPRQHGENSMAPYQELQVKVSPPQTPL